MITQNSSPRHKRTRFGRALLGSLFLACGVFAAFQANAQETTPSAEPIVFVPPVVGAPGNRVGAGTRSGNTSSTAGLSLVAPSGGGLTRLETPVLYWWIEAGFTGSVQIQIRADKTERPLLDLQENLSAPPGLQSFDLGSLGLRIRDRQIYEWSVTLHPAGNGTSRRAVTYLERQPANASDTAGDKAAAARMLASQGIWFDAFAIAARNPALEVYRNTLLDKIGIKPVAK